MSKTIIHIHRQRIARNLKVAPSNREPPIIVRQGKHREYVPDKPLDCGARVWIETEMGIM